MDRRLFFLVRILRFRGHWGGDAFVSDGLREGFKEALPRTGFLDLTGLRLSEYRIGPIIRLPTDKQCWPRNRYGMGCFGGESPIGRFRHSTGGRIPARSGSRCVLPPRALIGLW